MGPLHQVYGGRVGTCALARCRVVSAKLANQNVRCQCSIVLGRFAYPPYLTRILLLVPTHGQVCIVVLGTHLVLVVLAALVICVRIEVPWSTPGAVSLLHLSYVLATCMYCGAWSAPGAVSACCTCHIEIKIKNTLVFDLKKRTKRDRHPDKIL